MLLPTQHRSHLQCSCLTLKKALTRAQHNLTAKSFESIAKEQFGIATASLEGSCSSND